MEENEGVQEALNARERSARLNDELKRAKNLGVLNPDSAALNLRQLLNTMQTQITRSDGEIASLQSQIDQWKGQKRQATRLSELLINQISAHNQTAERVLEEERVAEKGRLEEERERLEEEKANTPVPEKKAPQKGARKASPRKKG